MSSPVEPGSWPIPGVLAAGVGAAALVGTGAYLWSAHGSQAKLQPPVNVEWHKVGTLSALYFFPLKSARYVPVESLDASEMGLRNGAFQDRSLVAVDASGNFISARSHPKMELVIPSIDGEVLTLSCQDQSIGTLTIDLTKIPKGPEYKIRVWDRKIIAVDCGDEAAAWIRKAVVEKDKHGEAGVKADLRLMFHPRSQSGQATEDKEKELGLYSDKSSYSLVSTASLNDLNSRLQRPITVLNFRSNFLIDGPKAYEEDSWKWVRIGEKAIFHVQSPCSRCIMTTVDPETGVKSADMEPLKTLRTYRVAEGELRKKTGDTPILALWMGLYQTGNISVGDAVYVPREHN